ncbi:MAG: trehalose-6-phosphate synthase [SAR202 cluster bacterium Casp-Chloro-G2]|nr:MAG: trehalose-6-phosphate synthase [SAR202 cluster bacterium Casp-Chloro-G2]
MVVSNRQPYIHELIEGKMHIASPAGGLTTAIDPLMQECGGTWVAYGGGEGDLYAVDEKNRIQVPSDDPSYTLRLVWLTQQEQQGYYNGFSNEGLWPLCHNAFIEPTFQTSDWHTYKSVNSVFAKQVLDEVDGRPAAVFTQDYHLALLPRMLRQADPTIITGQFWHIPWPTYEIFRICPWGDQLLDGLLGNDLLGFHIGDHCNNFMEAAARVLGARVHDEYNVVYQNEEPTLVRPFPISVDFEHVSQESQSQEVTDEMGRVMEEMDLGGKVVGLGIDRIDYTKGIPHRIRAIGRFFEVYPDYIGKVVFVQAGVMSRTKIDAYQHLSAEIDEELKAVNDRFGTGNWLPIIYLPDNLSAVTLAALRRIARFCVVSSLHDGMNLVAKEYVASRFDEDGVLILSPFTGAASELTDALIVNPYATDDFADAIRDAVIMPHKERRERMVRMRNVVEENNIFKWAARLFVDMMQGTRRARRPIRSF